MRLFTRKKKRRQQPFNPFICEDCSTERGKHEECEGCYRENLKCVYSKVCVTYPNCPQDKGDGQGDDGTGDYSCLTQKKEKSR